MAVELFADAAVSTTVAASKTAPAPGTSETWTVASSTGFPAAATGVSQFRIQEDNATTPSQQSEVILVTNVSGTTWTVTRGAEGTTPITHAAGFTIVPTLTAGVMANLLQLDGTQTVTGAKTFAGGAGVLASTNPGFSIGRSSTDAWLGVASATNAYASGSVAGDTILRSENGKLHLGSTSAGAVANLVLTSGTGAVNTGALSVLGTGSSAVQLGVRGASGQSVAIQEWQSSTPATIAKVQNDGSAIFGIPNSTSGVLVGGGSSGTGFGTVMAATAANALEIQGPWGGSTGQLRLGNSTGGILFGGALDIQTDTNIQAQNVIDWLNGTYGRMARLGGLNGHELYNHSTSTGAATGGSVVFISNAKTSHHVLRLQHPTSATGDYIQFGVAGSGDKATINASGVFTSYAGATAITAPNGDIVAGYAVKAPSVIPTGLTGATAAGRFVGFTTSGAPTTGTFSTGDFVFAQNGHVWGCTLGGTPGTWADAGTSSGVASVAGRSGVVTLTAADIGPGTYPAGAHVFAGALSGITTLATTGNYTITKNAPSVQFTDGTNTGVIGVASAASDLATNSLTGDLVIGAGTSPLYSGRVYVPGSMGIIGQVTTLSDVVVSGATLVLGDDSTPTTPSSTQSGLYSSSGRPKVKDAAGGVWDLDSERVIRLDADVTTTTVASPPTVTSGMSDVLTAGDYKFVVEGTWRSSATTAALRLAITYSGTATAINTSGTIAGGVSSITNVAINAINTTMVGGTATAAATDYIYRIYGTIKVSTSGTFDVKFGPSSAATLTMRTGSTLTVKRIP